MNTELLYRYLERIGLDTEPTVSAAGLNSLLLHHTCSIPFENLDTLSGRPVVLEATAIRKKLIDQRRGGYCFEQNTLLADVLTSIGFSVTTLAARVLWNMEPDPARPRTHMALQVMIDEQPWICDVGFGGATPTAAIALNSEEVQQTRHEPCRILRSGQEHLLEICLGERWRAAYEFELTPHRRDDYEAMNTLVQTAPDSPFPRVLMAGITDRHGRFTLRDNELRRYEAGKLVRQEFLLSASALESALADCFRINLPADRELRQALERIAAASRA